MPRPADMSRIAPDERRREITGMLAAAVVHLRARPGALPVPATAGAAPNCPPAGDQTAADIPGAQPNGRESRKEAQP